MKKAFAFIRIIRPINFLITFFSIVVSGIICSNEYNNFKVMILAGLSGALVASAGNVINDIFDIEIDKVNRPQRVIPSGLIKRSEAVYYYLFLNIAAIALALIINTASFIIVVASIIIVFLYSYKFKKIPLLGNFLVAFMTGLAFIFGGVAVGNGKAAFIPSLFAFFINFIREIIKDIEDMEGDMKNHVFSFPAKYGIKAAVQLVFFLTIILLLITLVPFVFKLYHIEYFIIVMLTVNTGLIFFLSKLTGRVTKAIISRQSFLLKLYMIFGLIAIYFGN